MKILIIGSKGFIGAHCVEYFSDKYEMWQCDIVKDDDANFFLLDPSQPNYDVIFENQQFDVCINCSGAANVSFSVEYPQQDFNLNAVNVYKQLDALRKNNPSCKYINLSSAAVYGNPSELPIKEDHSLQPISPYGYHKKMAEGICEQFTSHFGMHTCSLRIFSAYGAGLEKQLFWDLYKKSKEAKEIALFGTGKESRDFIYVTDLVKAMELIIEKSHFKADIINVANGVEIEIAEAVSVFYEHFNQDAQYHFQGQQREGDPINWVADIGRLRSMGYEPSISINEGLSLYAAWLNEKG